MSSELPLHAVFRHHPDWLDDETPLPDLGAVLRDAAARREAFLAAVEEERERDAREGQERRYAEIGIEPLREWDE